MKKFTPPSASCSYHVFIWNDSDILAIRKEVIWPTVLVLMRQAKPTEGRMCLQVITAADWHSTSL